MSVPQVRQDAWQEPETEIVPSRPVSGLAVLCAIVGLLSLLAFFDLALLVFPLATVVLAVLAWRHLYKFDPPAMGMGAIRFALVLAVFGGVGGPVHLLSLRGFLVSESKAAAERFVALLQQNKPHLAFQLTRDPTARLPIEEEIWREHSPEPQASDQLIWDSIAKDSLTREDFEGFVNRFPVRTLLHLNGNCRVRYYSSPVAQQRHGKYQVHHLYAVTYNHEGRTRTVVLAIQLERQRLREKRQADWVVTDVFGPVDPNRYP
ncbi:MAG: hypothetical protein NZ899_14075 [Thermoguttaceae bacterium]|nr:hypothetical protein [Thermoguttaceae bacterium]MDW8080138.1 hypothetical protein [Thermoguttaceae bacterium]